MTNTQPKVSVISKPGGRTLWQLEEDYLYHWGHGGRWYRFMVDAGFEFDGASVPRFLRWIAGRGRFGVLGPMCHDWVIARKGEVDLEWFTDDGWDYYGFQPQVQFTRRQADRLFFRILREQGVRPRWLRRGAFRIVRLWSWFNGDKWE